MRWQKLLVFQQIHLANFYWTFILFIHHFSFIVYTPLKSRISIYLVVPLLQARRVLVMISIFFNVLNLFCELTWSILESVLEAWGERVICYFWNVLYVSVRYISPIMLLKLFYIGCPPGCSIHSWKGGIEISCYFSFVVHFSLQFYQCLLHIFR